MVGNFLYLLISVLSVIKDLTNKDIRRCIDVHKHISLLITFHTLFRVFLLFGWLLTPMWVVKTHLFIFILILLYWLVFKKTATDYVTEYITKTCELDKKSQLNFIDKTLKTTSIEWLFYLLAVVASVYRIKNPDAKLNLHTLFIIAVLIPFVPPF